ncbi:MAG: isoprenylcysteine carboxylmethyltransferase family protein [Syntrophomonadaceae bacterium]|nr:isoprenylcysteine carboxylmethyltransferase family protein [Syntrophomonadaceae bacterium]
MTRRRLPPILYFVVLFLAAIVISISIEGITIIRSPLSCSGAVLAILGIVIILWSESLFRSAGTSVRPDRKPTKLNMSGPFRYSRNPMYMGLNLILAGEAVALGHISLLLFPLVFFIICHTLFIPEEERILEEIFGPEYIDYKKRVRRWL